MMMKATFVRVQHSSAPGISAAALSWLLFLNPAVAFGQASQFTSDANGNLLAQIAENLALPRIISQPQPQVVMPGAVAAFLVVAADNRGLSYQWRLGNVQINGATNDTLLLNPVRPSDEGSYTVVLSNSSGQVTSAPAALLIDSDGDGLPDSWELAHFGNLNQTATGDFDGDGVSNLQEYLDGTDPANANSARFRLTALQDGGLLEIVPAQSSYTNGQTVTLTATALSAGTFHGWTGDLLSRETTVTLAMTNNKVVIAHFTPMEFVWSNPTDGDWNVAANWSPGLVPGSYDNVTIARPVGVAVNQDVDCFNLTFGAPGVAPTLSGSATLTAHGNSTWTAGTMTGSGRTLIDTAGSLTIPNADFVYLAGRTLENAGRMTWTGTGDFLPSAGAVITNRAGALFEVQSSASFRGAPGTPARVDNAGTFRKSGSAATTFFGTSYAVPFFNYGTVDLQTGVLAVNGGRNDGSIAVPANTALILAGPSFVGGAGSSIAGAGDLILAGETIVLDGLVDIQGGISTTGGGTAALTGQILCTNNTLNLSFGTVSFAGTGVVTPAVVNLNGGTLDGSMLVTVAHSMNWTAGAMSGTGRTLVPSGVTLMMSNTSPVYLDGRTLENAGTVLWAGSGDFSLSAGAVITNRARALFDVQSSASFRGAPGPSARIDNAGTFRKSVSEGTTVLGASYPVLFFNYNTVDIQAGVLALNGGRNDGTIAVPAATQLSISGFPFVGGAGSSITGAGDLILGNGTITLDGLLNVSGTVSVNGASAALTGKVICTNNTLNLSGGTATFAGTGLVGPAVVNLNGGTLDGSMLVTVGNSMAWTTGSMTGAGRTLISPGATLTIANSASIYLNARTLENGGTVLWTGAADFDPSAGAVVTNRAGALFDVQNSGSFRALPGSTPRIDNAGTFRKSGSVGTTAVGFSYPVSFNNYGTVDIRAGVLACNSGYASSPDSSVSCALWGTVPGATYGQLQAAGTIDLHGTLSVSLVSHFTPATNDSFTVVSAGTVNGSFAKFVYPTDVVSMVLSNSGAADVVRVTGVVPPRQSSPLALAPGILSWWRAENDASDAVGVNNGYLTNGATFATGIEGQSFLLNGTDAYVVIPDSPSLRPSSVTVEAWVRIFSTNGTVLIFAKPLGSGTFDSYGMALVNGAPLAAICNNGGFGTFISSPEPLEVGQWYHLAYTFDGTTRQEALYVNGASVAAADAGRTMDFDAHPLFLGVDIENGVPSYFLDGQIDEAALYSRALAPDEVASIYNVGSAGKAPLAPYEHWKAIHLNDASAPDTGDPDNDGYSTLLEYGLALLPEIPDPPHLPQVSLFDYGADGKRLRTILQRDPAHNDVTVEVQGSSDFTTGWQSLAGSTNGLPFQGIGYVGGDGAGSEIKTVEIRDSASTANAPRRFLRIKVTH
jgi:hypothetical protein